jgi:ribosome-associated heat shock protein Hsp15
MTTDVLRVDKWLWYARFYRSRTLAARHCQSGRLRVNGIVVRKAHHALKPGDVLAFPLGTRIRVIRVVELGCRRGPAVEARSLYEDIDPPVTQPVSTDLLPPAVVGKRAAGSGRPTKVDRRATDRPRNGS